MLYATAVTCVHMFSTILCSFSIVILVLLYFMANLYMDPSSFTSGLEKNNQSDTFFSLNGNSGELPMLLEPEQMDWASWDKLLAGFDGEGVGDVGVGGSFVF